MKSKILIVAIIIIIGVSFVTLRINSNEEPTSNPIVEKSENSKEEIEKPTLKKDENSKEEIEEEYTGNSVFYKKYKIKELKLTTERIDEMDSISNPPYLVYHFHYSEPYVEDEHYKYGAGFLISKIENETEKLIWYYLLDGDDLPHTFHWIDFNNDGKKDIYILSGSEDSFYTVIYLNRIADGQETEKNFIKIYENPECYATIADFNQDTIPELIIGIDTDYVGIQIPETFSPQIDKEYDKVIGTFESKNQNYNRSNDYKTFNLFLSEKYQILGFRQDTFVDVTKKYIDHAKWRKNLIEQIKSKPVSDNESDKFIHKRTEGVKRYLDSIVKTD